MRGEAPKIMFVLGVLAINFWCEVHRITNFLSLKNRPPLFPPKYSLPRTCTERHWVYWASKIQNISYNPRSHLHVLPCFPEWLDIHECFLTTEIFSAHTNDSCCLQKLDAERTCHAFRKYVWALFIVLK